MIRIKAVVAYNAIMKLTDRVLEMFDVSVNCERKSIGHLESDRFVFILGPIDAENTSLLIAISKRYRVPIGGKFLLNGEPNGKKTITTLSRFVSQFDITIDSLMPNELL